MEKLRKVYTASAASKVVTILNRLVLLPCVAALLSPKDYAYFTLLVSAITFLGGLDVGIGGGALMRIAKAYAIGDRRDVWNTSIRAFVSAAILSAAFLLLGAVLHYRLSWMPALEQVLGAISNDVVWAVLAFSLCILVQSLYNMSVRVMQGIARQGDANYMGAVVNLGFSCSIGLCVIRRSSDLSTYALALVSVYLVAQTGCLLYTRRSLLKVRGGTDVGANGNNQVRTGLVAGSLPFAMIACAVFLERECPKWIWSGTGEVLAVARMGIYSIIVFAGIGMVQMILMPYWPMLLNLRTNQAEWARRLLFGIKCAAFVGGGIVAIGCVAAVVGDEFSRQVWSAEYGWTKAEWLAFGVYFACTAPRHVLFPFLLGLERIKMAAVIHLVDAIVVIAVFKVVAMASLGLAGFFWCLAATSLVFDLPLYVLSIRPEIVRARELLRTV